MKRLFDLLVSLLLILVTSPLWVIIGFLIKCSIGGNVFFVQRRIGRDCKEFNLIKFRTMRPEILVGDKSDERKRLTTITSFLRNSSLDEIPELINVVKGEMSLIGPRPLLVEYLPHYSQVQNLRHRVRPGITGLAQISGRNQLKWKKKFQYDIYYVRNNNFCLDIAILLKTIGSIFDFSNVNSSKEISMPRFTGKD